MRIRIADILTTLRILVTPFIIWCLLNGHHVAAFYLFAAGAITDTLDGFFARRSKIKVTYGDNFDALADFCFGFTTIFFVVYVQKAYFFLIITLVAISYWAPVIYLISKKSGKLNIPHLDTNLLAAGVYPTVMAYILNWKYIPWVRIYLIGVLLYYMWKYAQFVRDLYREATP